MKQFKAILLSLVLIVNVMSPAAVCASNANTVSDAFTPALKADEKVTLSSEADTAAYKNAVFITEAEFLCSKSINDGITVVYGSNLDVDALNERIYGKISVEKEDYVTQGYADDLVYDESTGEYIHDDSPYYGMPIADLIETEEAEEIELTTIEHENVYIAIFSNDGDKISKTYVSVYYDADVDADVIDNFIEAELSEESLDNYLKDELNRQTERNSFSASTANTRAASYSRIVDETVRQASKIANYTVSSNTYPVMVYKYRSVYTSILIANELVDRDRYILHNSAYITPGNAISSSEASGIYNNQYRNAIVVCGAKVFFENKYPEMDYYIDMMPKLNDSNVTDVSSISIDLGVSAFGLSASIPIAFETGSKVAASYKFTPEDQCYFMFEGTTLLYRKCLSTEPFLIASTASLSSGYSQLYTTFGTHVKYHFGANTSDCVWSGRATDVYYENNE